MKYKSLIFSVILVSVTLLASWTVPTLVQKMTDDSHSYPLMYYSARLKELCVIDFREHKNSFYDIHGNEYPRAQYDSLLPLLNYRQLAMEGQLPDSLEGQAIDVKILRSKQVMFRFRPVDVFSPQPAMGVLLEAMPQRGNLMLPGDYFRMDHELTFVDAQSNSVNRQKSEIFTKELIKKGFSFPVKAYWGNPTVRKPYEEGYFCLDSKGALFHLKMVNGRPFVKDTGIGSQLGIKWFVMSETSDKRFYGYLFGEKGEMGLLESTDEGGYRFLPFDIRPVDITKDEISILGNLLYWTVRVSDAEGMDCYGLDAVTLQSLSSYHQDRKRVLWDELSEWLFPFRLSPSSETSSFVNLYAGNLSSKGLAVSFFLALLTFFLCRNKVSLYRRILMALCVCGAGLSGIVALLFLPWNKYE